MPRARLRCEPPAAGTFAACARQAAWIAAAVASTLLAAAPAGAATLEKTTTSYTTIGGDPAAPYSRLKLGPGWKRVVRDDLAAPRKGRLARRRSLMYFAQLSDFQLADEESPARAELLDVAGLPFESAWRPQEALEPFTVDEVVRQVNRFSESPVRNRRRRHARLALTITTGDSADSQQINEVRWVVKLLEGGRLDPNSGVEGGVCGAVAGPPGEAARYTGVQDEQDILESGRFYDPNRPTGAFAAWPSLPGLMDRAQLPFETPGLNRPSYVSFGNHDGEVQGNIYALKALDDVARGCVKPLGDAGVSTSPRCSRAPFARSSCRRTPRAGSPTRRASVRRRWTNYVLLSSTTASRHRATSPPRPRRAQCSGSSRCRPARARWSCSM